MTNMPHDYLNQLSTFLLQFQDHDNFHLPVFLLRFPFFSAPPAVVNLDFIVNDGLSKLPQ